MLRAIGYIAGVLLILGMSPSFACVDGSELAYVVQSTKAAVVQISSLGMGPDCTIKGTGFFISPAGHVLTAQHLVPLACANLSVKAYREGISQGIPLKVLQRSSSDVVLLAPEVPVDVPYIGREMVADPKSYLEQKVVVETFYHDSSRVTYTGAKVDDVAPIGANEKKWTLCGPGPNASVSGSPVLARDGKAIAVFTERATEDQDRFRVVPLNVIKDLDWGSIPTSDAAVLVAVRPESSGGGGAAEIAYNFPLDLGADDHPPIGQTNGRFIFSPDGHFSDAKNLSVIELGIRALGGDMVRYKVLRVQAFEAFPGYRFAPDLPKIEAASHNPPTGPLPDHSCRNEGDENCYQLSPDGKKLTIKVVLFVGPDIDRARSWLNGYMFARLIRAS